MVAVAITTRVRPLDIRPSIRTNDGQSLDVLDIERERAFRILQQNSARCADLTDELVVITLNVDMLIRQLALIVRILRVVVKIDFRVVVVLTELVVRCHDACNHVFEAGLRDRTILDSAVKLGSPIRVIGSHWVAFVRVPVTPESRLVHICAVQD